MDTGHGTTTIDKGTPLRRFIDARGIRYIWIAEKLGISPSHLTQIMDGKRPLVAAHAATLADLFSVPAETFAPEPNE